LTLKEFLRFYKLKCCEGKNYPLFGTRMGVLFCIHPRANSFLRTPLTVIQGKYHTSYILNHENVMIIVVYSFH